MLKLIDGRKMSNDNRKVYIKSFSGATTTCMTDYIKPTQNYKPDCIIIDCGTNDLRTGEEPKSIAKRIMDLAISSERDENTICIPGIVPRNDKAILKEKAVNVNEVLQKLCYSRNMCLSVMITSILHLI